MSDVTLVIGMGELVVVSAADEADDDLNESVFIPARADVEPEGGPTGADEPTPSLTSNLQLLASTLPGGQDSAEEVAGRLPPSDACPKKYVSADGDEEEPGSAPQRAAFGVPGGQVWTYEIEEGSLSAQPGAASGLPDGSGCTKKDEEEPVPAQARSAVPAGQVGAGEAADSLAGESAPAEHPDGSQPGSLSTAALVSAAAVAQEQFKGMFRVLPSCVPLCAPQGWGVTFPRWGPGFVRVRMLCECAHGF